MKYKLNSSFKKRIKIVGLGSLIIVVVAMGVIIYKNTPKQKAISVSNAVINSLKNHDGKDAEFTDGALTDKLSDSDGEFVDFNGSFDVLNIFDYKLKSVSEITQGGLCEFRKYNITYYVNYATIDGHKKSNDITLIAEEKTHNKSDFKVIDIQGIY